ncbi:MAG: hypothetical protein IKH74_01920 [Lachnospiraceae bacterium]|nr:hypothetical protein [Lachnospiraceae bacterium]
MTIARDDGVIDRGEGKAAIGLVIKPTGRGDADSAVTLMGTTNPDEVTSVLAHAAASLISQMAKDPIMMTMLADLLKKKIDLQMVNKTEYKVINKDIKPE